MLRITVKQEGSTARFIVEGTLVMPWVAELRKCWQVAARAKTKHSFIDLAGVTSIDPQGRILLTEMHRQGAQLLAKGLLTQAIVEEIQNNGK